MSLRTPTLPMLLGFASPPPTYEFVNLMILGHGRTLFSKVSSVLKISQKIKSLLCIQQNRSFPCYESQCHNIQYKDAENVKRFFVHYPLILCALCVSAPLRWIFITQALLHMLNLTHQLSLLRTSNALNLNDFFEHFELTVWVIRFHPK